MANETEKFPRLDPVGKLWASAWSLYKQRFEVLTKILLPPAALFILANLLRLRGPVGIALGGLLSLIGGVVLAIASIALIFALYKDTNFGASYKSAFKAFWPFVWVSILTGLAVVGGAVILIIPGIFLAIALGFSQYTFVVEGKRGMNALLQSKEYVKGYWWAVLGRMVLLGIVLIIVSAIVGAIFGVLLGPVGAAIISAIVLVFITPFSVAYKFSLFENTRRTKPALRESQAKEGRGFLVASGIVGLVVPILVFFVIVAAIGFGAFSVIRNAMQNTAPSGGALFSNPVIFHLDPSSGPTGTEVTLYGLGLAATNTVEFDGLVSASLRNLQPSKDGTLTFTVPESVGPDCVPGEACAQFLKELTPGTYNVTVVENGTASNALVYTVPGTPLAP